MKLTNPSDLKNYLRAIGFRPKDYMGQNFLVDEVALGEIVKASNLSKSDLVLEIGPGLGVLTGELIKQAGKVIAIEKDQKLANILHAELVSASHKKDPARSDSSETRREINLSRTPIRDSGWDKLQLINQDILRFHLDKYIDGPYKVVANIPYYLTSKLFQYFLAQKNKPEFMVLMVQREVGERVVAKPGKLSVLGISVQIEADAEIVTYVPKESFWPTPEVDSMILKITPRDKYPEITDKKLFFSIVKRAFAGKRKQIKNTLKDIEILKKAGVDPTARPQDLSIADWIRVYKA